MHKSVKSTQFFYMFDANFKFSKNKRFSWFYFAYFRNLRFRSIMYLNTFKSKLAMHLIIPTYIIRNGTYSEMELSTQGSQKKIREDTPLPRKTCRPYAETFPPFNQCLLYIQTSCRWLSRDNFRLHTNRNHIRRLSLTQINTQFSFYTTVIYILRKFKRYFIFLNYHNK